MTSHNPTAKYRCIRRIKVNLHISEIRMYDIVGVLIILMMMMNACSLAGNVIVINIHGKRAGTAMSKITKFIIFGCLGPVLMCKKRHVYPKNVSNDDEQTSKPKKSDLHVHDLVEGKDVQKMNREEVDDSNETEREDAADILDRFFFVLFSAIFIGLAVYAYMY